MKLKHTVYLTTLFLAACNTCPPPQVCEDCTPYQGNDVCTNMGGTLSFNEAEQRYQCIVAPTYDIESALSTSCINQGGQWITEEKECLIRLPSPDDPVDEVDAPAPADEVDASADEVDAPAPADEVDAPADEADEIEIK